MILQPEVTRAWVFRAFVAGAYCHLGPSEFSGDTT